jgi:cytochrome P450
MRAVICKVIITTRENSAANVTLSFAGSDTTAIALRSILYNLLKNPACFHKARAEVDAAALSDPVTFSEGQSLTYIQAVMKEALRMHPAVGQLLERVVPESGFEINGVFLPAGTIVGINPWIAARDQSVYGADAAEFRPERWLEASSERLRLMERNFLAVSIGTD